LLINPNLFFSIAVRVVIKKEDIYVGAVVVSLDGMRIWSDLTVKLFNIKINDHYFVSGVNKIIINKIEAEENDQIDSASLESIIADCTLGEFGVFFFFKCVYA
jgi:hypothetical protein